MIFSSFSSLMSTYNLFEEYKKPWQNDAYVLCFYYLKILKVVFPKEFHIKGFEFYMFPLSKRQINRKQGPEQLALFS